MFLQGLNLIQGSCNYVQSWGLNLPRHCSLLTCLEDFKLLFEGMIICLSLIVKFRCLRLVQTSEKVTEWNGCWDKQIFVSAILPFHIPLFSIWVKYEPAGWRTEVSRNQERSGHESNGDNFGSVFECRVAKCIRFFRLHKLYVAHLAFCKVWEWDYLLFSICFSKCIERNQSSRELGPQQYPQQQQMDSIIILNGLSVESCVSLNQLNQRKWKTLKLGADH